MILDNIQCLLKERATLDDNDSDAVDKCCKKVVNMLSEDINATISFMDTECTEDEFSWISEVFDEIVEKTQSQEFIDCLYRVAEKYPVECDKYNIYHFIEESKKFLN